MHPPTHPTIALLQSSSLTSVVQREIERAILAGDHPPGSKLTEATLAERLGVSRGPVREAFRMLEEAGLLRTEKNRGVFVRDIPMDEAVEIFDLRAAMEELVGRQLAERITPAQLKEARALVDAMEKAVKSSDIPAYHQLNLQFHDRLVEMAGNRKLTAIHRKLTKELSLFRLRNLREGDTLPVSASEHRQIVKAIGSGDAAAAGRALFDHVMESKARTLDNEERRRAQEVRTGADVPTASGKARRAER
ncbi:MAG: phosphonate utilization associated transcriptional regulator [Betaproteobacteria bacterium]|nr:phosphonate utilization associated transcriptional regulator [Betaproteobacteria bacterium]